MAQVDLAAIAATLTTIFEERITSQINRATVLLQLLEVGPGQGKNVQWSARFGTSVGAKIADGADVSAYNNDNKVPASLDYGTYHDPFSITGKAAAGAMAAGNPAELENLFADEMGDSIERLAKILSQEIYAGAGGTDEISGLLATSGALDTTGTYAGINRATYAQWASNEVANGGVDRALTFDLMREMRRTIYGASGLKPDLIVCDEVMHEKYGSLFGDQRRYIQDVRMRGEKITLDGGYQVLEFDGIPVVEDVDCPAGTMIFLNTRHAKICQMPDPANAINQAMGNAQLSGTEEEQFGLGQTQLTARVNPLARTGDAFKFQLITYPQLQIRRPNACGSIVDIDPAL